MDTDKSAPAGTATRVGARPAVGSRAAVRAPAVAGLPVAVWVPVALAVLLGAAYLAAPPMGTDLAAQVARAEFFAAHGWAPLDFGWYGGISPYGYSLVSPPLMALLGGGVVGAKLLGALSAVVSTAALAVLLSRTAARRPVLGGVAGAACFAGNLVSGRTTYALGVAFGLLALVAAGHRNRRVRAAGTPACAVLTGLTSPVAALFLGLAGAAWALSGLTRARSAPAADHRARLPLRWDPARLRTGLLLMVAAGVPMLAMALPFGAGGWMNISRWDTYRAAGAGLLVALLVPRRPVRIGALLSTAGVVTAYAVHTPVGLNATRLPVMFALPLLAGYVPIPVPRRLPAPARPWLRAAGVAAVLAAAVLWQPPVATPDLRGAGDPAAEPRYFAPLLAELERRAPVGRVEVVPLANYWDAAYVPAAAPLARGWLRQADLAYNPMFFDGKLTATEYGAWLRDNGVSYVALADAEPSWIGRVEASLVRAGPPYLTRVWSGGHWSLYRVSGSPSIVDGAELVRSGPAGLTLDAPAGRTLVRVRWSPWLSVRGRPDGGGATRSGGDAVDGGDGGACLAQRGDWIELRADRPGRYEITGSLTARGPFCP